MRKPFIETKIGKFLSGKGFDAILGVGSALYPPLAAVDAVKDIIIGNAEQKFSPEEISEFKVAYQDYLQELDLYLKEMANARSMYAQKSEMADLIARLVMRWNLPMIFALIIIQVTAFYYLDKMLVTIVSTIIGGLITALLSERQSLMNFFFGSSAGSKASGDAIRKKLNDPDNVIGNK